MIILSLLLVPMAFMAGYRLGRRGQAGELRVLHTELEQLRDPELLRIAALRRQMGQEQRAFNLLCNYGTELAYGQVSAADMMDNKEGQA